MTTEQIELVIQSTQMDH